MVVLLLPQTCILQQPVEGYTVDSVFSRESLE